MAFWAYMLRCSDGTYYTGHTDDIESRMSQHHDGSVGYTAARKPLKLLWQGEFETREGALAFEQQVKGWREVGVRSTKPGHQRRPSIQSARHPAPRSASETSPLDQIQQTQSRRESFARRFARGCYFFLGRVFG